MDRLDITFDDPEEMPERMASLAENFAIRPTRRGAYTARLNAVRLGDVALFRISMTEARVTASAGLGSFCINLPLSSPLQAHVAGRTETFLRNSAYAANPEDPFDLLMPEDGGAMVMNVFRPTLDDYAAAMDGGTGSQPLYLPNRLRLDHPAGRAFQRYLAFLWSEIQRDSPLLASGLLVEEWEKALLTSLLLAADPRQDRAEETVPPAYLRRAVDFIMAQLAEPLSLGQIAAAAGVNARTLQRAFQRQHGSSVMALVQERRLERTNAQLSAADPDAASVTEIALDNGFAHLGRFSAAYRHRFGEYPSETLRRP